MKQRKGRNMMESSKKKRNSKIETYTQKEKRNIAKEKKRQIKGRGQLKERGAKRYLLKRENCSFIDTEKPNNIDCGDKLKNSECESRGRETYTSRENEEREKSWRS